MSFPVVYISQSSGWRVAVVPVLAGLPICDAIRRLCRIAILYMDTREGGGPQVLWVGFDVGGTFTDLVAIDLEARRMFTTKTPSSSTDPATAALLGVTDLLEIAGAGPDRVSRIVHERP